MCASVLLHREIQRNVDHGNLFSLCLINHSHNYIVRRSHIVLVFISRCLRHASSVTKNGSVKKETFEFLNFVNQRDKYLSTKCRVVHFYLENTNLPVAKKKKEKKNKNQNS